MFLIDDEIIHVFTDCILINKSSQNLFIFKNAVFIPTKNDCIYIKVKVMYIAVIRVSCSSIYTQQLHFHKSTNCSFFLILTTSETIREKIFFLQAWLLSR